MTTAQMIKDAIARALAAVRLPFRAVLGGLNGKPGVQLAQGDALNGEKLEASEVFQQFGFTSGVPAGSELIVLPLGGKTAHSVIVATENGAYPRRARRGYSGRCRRRFPLDTMGCRDVGRADLP